MKSLKKITYITAIMASLFITPVNAESTNGMIRIKSNHSVSTTIDKLESVLKNKGMTIFKRVNHSAGAEKVGMTLRASELLIFGNPKVGTPLMQCSQTAAIDLPQKALAYKDEDGQVWLTYNDPLYIAKRHGIQNCDKAIQKVTKALAKFSNAATK